MSKEGTLENPSKYADAPERDPNPRGPDAPDPEKAGEQRLVVERHPDASELEGKLGAGIRWIGTNGYNYDAGRGGYAIAGIVIHTEVGTNAGATARFKTPNQASAHYGVAYDGSYIDQWVRETDTAWHCGRYFPDAGHMGNRNSIGIEHEDNGAYNSPRPDALYEASAQLVADICRRYGLPATHNTIRGEAGHREISVVGTGCPDSLDVDRIIARAAAILKPPPPPVPSWKTSLHAEAYAVVLPASVPLYDLTTGKPTGLSVGAGTFESAYRGTIGGVDYRVTAYSFQHDTPRGVKTADVVVVPPPVVPEWKKNLKPEAHSWTLAKAVPLHNMETGAKTPSMVGPGPLQVQFATSAGGVAYYMTQYSVQRDVPNGLMKTEVEAAIVVVPPTPPVDPPVDPTPTPPSSFWQTLIDLIRSIFGAKKQ